MQSVAPDGSQITGSCGEEGGSEAFLADHIWSTSIPKTSTVAVGAWSRPCAFTHLFPNTQGPSANQRKASVWIACLPPKPQIQGWGPQNCK